MRPLRHALTALLEGTAVRRRPALRRCDDPRALLATDLPQAAEDAAVADFIRRAEAEGWTVLREGGWLLMDHPVPVPDAAPCQASGEAGCCLQLLRRHPGGDAPPGDVRELLKAAETGQTERLCARWHAEWAGRLRLHQPLPGGLLPYLAAISSNEEEAT